MHNTGRGEQRVSLYRAALPYPFLFFVLLCAVLVAGMPVGEALAKVNVSLAQRKERALLIGVDEFVSRPDTYPSSTNNVYAMQEIFQAAQAPLEALIIPSEPVVEAGELTELIRETFAGATEWDVSYLYISTHGNYDAQSNEEPALLLSDGEVENRMTAAELEAAFDGIAGKKVIILDACNSGAFIGKGAPNWTRPIRFLGDDFKVITSSGALEESWYWNAEETEDIASPFGSPKTPQGAFYFTQELLQSLSPRYGYPSDSNHDGEVTLQELYEYLLENHAASTPQVYPQRDDFVVFRYDPQEPLPRGQDRSPILDITFSGTIVNQASQSVTLEYIATRPMRVGYQIVQPRDGKWIFDEAKLVFDDVERFSAFGDQEGAVSAGRKVRTLSLNADAQGGYGYTMVQLVSIDQGEVTVHAGRVFCIPPAAGELQLGVEVPGQYNPATHEEMNVFVRHAYPCALSVAVVNEQGDIVLRLCHRRSTRPSQTIPEGSLFYWDGNDKSGVPVPPGIYYIQVSGSINDSTEKILSDAIVIQ